MAFTNGNSSCPTPLKIFIHSMDGQGHLNACIGIAQALMKRGHRVMFLLNEAFKGQFAKFGFEEILLARKPVQGANPVEENPVKGFAKQLLKSGFLSGISPLEKMKCARPADPKDNFVQTLFDSTVDFNPQIETFIAIERPDFFILDHFLVPPVLYSANVPWAFLFSGNPLCLYRSDKLPPFGSGYATTSDQSTWKEFTEVSETYFRGTFVEYQKELLKIFNCELDDSEEVQAFAIRSKWLNIYGYPTELSYDDIVQVPENYVRVDAFLREVPEPFQLPEGFHKEGEKLVYVSLGSMGSVDVDLMKRIVSALAKTSHKYIVSKGPRHDEYELPANCWGLSFLPQTRILPLVDLVITHGGNNTVTETFAAGKPMIVMPLFGDQYDNAQRIKEKGFGIRLETYAFQEQELIDAVEKLLNDSELQQRLSAAAERIATSNSKEKMCLRIEDLVRTFKQSNL